MKVFLAIFALALWACEDDSTSPGGGITPPSWLHGEWETDDEEEFRGLVVDSRSITLLEDNDDGELEENTFPNRDVEVSETRSGDTYELSISADGRRLTIEFTKKSNPTGIAVCTTDSGESMEPSCEDYIPRSESE